MIMNHNSVKVIHVLDTECFLSTCNHHFCIVIVTFVQLLKLNVHGEISSGDDIFGFLANDA